MHKYKNKMAWQVKALVQSQMTNDSSLCSGAVLLETESQYLLNVVVLTPTRIHIAMCACPPAQTPLLQEGPPYSPRLPG